MAPTALLHAALEDLLAAADGFGENCAFFERVRDGLFEVDVFAAGDGVGGDAHVPMIGSRDDDGVELLVEDFFVIDVRCGARTGGALFDGFAARSVDVADSDDLIAADAVGGVEEIAHPAAGADDADAKRVVSPEDASGGESGHSGGDDEVAAVHWGGHGGSILGQENGKEKLEIGNWTGEARQSRLGSPNEALRSRRLGT